MSFREDLRRLGQFAALSVLVHLALWPFASMWVISVDPPERKPQRVRLINLSGTQQAHKKKPQTKRPAAESKPPEENIEELKGQVVDVPPSADDRVPEDSRFLSEFNTNTERETVSRNQRRDYRTAMNEVTQTHKPKNQAPEAQQARSLEIGPDEPNRRKKEATPDLAFQLPTQKQQLRLALNLDSLGRLRNKRQVDALKGNSDRLKLSLGESTELAKGGSAQDQGERQLQLMPSLGVLAQIAGAPANDHLDLEEGEGTFLNSRRFKYASFFNRMKRSLSQHWNPMLEYRRRDPTGNVYGQEARVTVLKVTLNADGGLERVWVSRSSGLEFLDHEAMSAFRRAGPFPNPPKGLVADGKSFDFGFHIQLTRNGALRLPF